MLSVSTDGLQNLQVKFLNPSIKDCNFPKQFTLYFFAQLIIQCLLDSPQTKRNDLSRNCTLFAKHLPYLLIQAIEVFIASTEYKFVIEVVELIHTVAEPFSDVIDVLDSD